MAEPFPVEWQDVNLADMLPEEITDLVQDVLVPITDFIGGAAEVSKATFQLLKSTTEYIPPVIDPTLLGIQASIGILTELINNLENAGGSLLVIPPSPGGLNQFGNVIRTQLSNKRNQEVPNYPPTAYAGAFGAVAYAPDLVAIRLIHDKIVLNVSVDDNIERKLGTDTLVGSTKFAAHDLKFKLARTASPQPDTPWVTVKASQLIPKSGEIAENIKQYLSGINTQIAASPFDSLIDLAQATIDSATAIAANLQTTADFIESVFPDTPLKFYKVEPKVGGSAGIFESTKDWFDITKHTEIEDVPENGWVTGYIVVFGASDLTSAQDIYTIWNDLLLP